MFKLRFPEHKIKHWSDRYYYPAEAEFENTVAPRGRERGYLMRDELIQLGRWKSPRSQPLIRRNPSDIVEAVTLAALESSHENVKIGVLRTLKGVSWPTASVILHFCDRRPYPILDFRALWSLGYASPPRYTLDFWLEYTNFTRSLAHKTGLSMRVVDRALWQYSSERQ
jgi:hypothetical protein